jgi:hypothetical protein
VLIESLPDERFDHGLPANVQILRSLIEFLQHGGSEVDVYALNRLHHATGTLEKPRHIFTLISQSRDRLG